MRPASEPSRIGYALRASLPTPRPRSGGRSASLEGPSTFERRSDGVMVDAPPTLSRRRDAWRVAAAAADVALQKAVQLDQQRMRVSQEYAAFRAGAANLATRAARDCHAELETAKARISVLEASLARYQASYPPPVGDEASSDGSALTATEAAPRAQPDVLAPTPRPGRARISVATPAPRPRRYATRSSTRHGRAD